MRFWMRLDFLLLFALITVLITRYLAPESQTIETVLIAISVIALLPVLRSAWQSLLDRQIAVDLLASIALIASFAAHEWTSAAFINLMLTSARIFGTHTARNTDRAIESLLEMKPKTVRIRRDDHQEEIPIEQVVPGEIVIIGSGERIPVDGIIIEGSTLIDESSLTGESLPVPKTLNDQVFSSTLNTDGTIAIRAEKVGADTTLEKIIRLVKDSQNSKVGIRTTAQTFANWYIGLILIGSIGLYTVTQDHTLVLAFLLIACADDIAIAIPLAFSAAIGNAAREGIIIKGGQFLEGLARTKTVILDKTGTLTTGMLSVAEIIPNKGVSPQDILSLAAALESSSTHPIAKAIRIAAETQGLAQLKAENLHEISGKGVIATVDGHEILCGRAAFLTENNINLPQNFENQQALSYLFVAQDRQHIGTILLADTLRPETTTVIRNLRASGIEHIIMLTGDNDTTARKIAQEASIEEFQANLLPENKLDYVRRSLNKKSKVVMVGDGVNDAASLMAADIGIAMGTIGSDTAIEAADIALMRDDLNKLPRAIALGRDVMRVSRQNFWIWGTVNVIGLILVFTRILNPAEAAAYNFIMDFVPIANSLRLFRSPKT